MVNWIIDKWLSLLFLLLLASPIIFYGVLIIKKIIRIKKSDLEVTKVHHRRLAYSSTPLFIKPEELRCRNELEKMTFGHIMFNPPEIMKQGKGERIETRIVQDRNIDLVTSLKGKGVPQIEDIRVSELMKVRLSGNAFEIFPLNEEKQVVEVSDHTEWAWDVTPKKSGKQILHLHVTMIIRLSSNEYSKDHPVLDREIVVKVNPLYSTKYFLSTYWKWIITALVIPLLTLILKSFF